MTMTSRHLADEQAGDKIVACTAARADLVHGCYHGSACIDMSNDDELLDRYCECDTTTDILTAGLMCEYRATSICTTTEYVSDQFCVNGGLCKSFVKGSASHPGCICKTGVWEGDHCEFAHGVLMDDALDMFHERKIALASELGVNKSKSAEVSTTAIKLGDTVVEVDRKGTPLFLVVAAVIAMLAVVVGLSIFTVRKLRQRRLQVCEEEYESISFSSSASPKSSHDSFSTPPLDVFLSSRKVEERSADENSNMLSPGSDAQDYDANDNVELLDAETSRMIEVQFENHVLHHNRERRNLEMSNEEFRESDSTFDFEDESIDGEIGLQRRKVMINCSKSIRPKILSSLAEIDEMDVHENEESSLPCHSGGGTDLGGDGDEDEDSDDGTYFV